MRACIVCVAVTIAFAGAACGGSALVGMAERGEYPQLKSSIAAREKAGDLSNKDAARVARAVASREIKQAKDAKDAKRRVHEVRACAKELDDALAERMKTHDEAGAEAALARLESGELDADDARRFFSDADDHWRAVGARAQSRAEDTPSRQKAMTDPSPEVRRAAIRAAQGAVVTADLAPLLEAARVDPEPIVRSEAVRAIAALPAQSPFDTATRLRDLWSSADEGLREDIAIAWTSPNVYGFGGKEALTVLVASAEGEGVIEASAAVLRAPHGGSGDDELRKASIAELARAIASGPKRSRLHAIAVVRADAANGRAMPLESALAKASTDDDDDIKIAALARLTEIPSHRDAAIKSLEVFAGNPGPFASRAKLALATAGDRRVQVWVEKDLSSDDPHDRLGALSALAALGVPARGAPLLADADASVRTEAACQLIMAARVHK